MSLPGIGPRTEEPRSTRSVWQQTPRATSAAVVAAIRRSVGRHPSVRASIVLLVAAVAGWSVWDATQEEERAAARWGERVEVWVADGPIHPGGAVSASSVLVPAAVVPTAALRADPTGSPALQRLGAGEIVVDHDLTSAVGPAALAPAGTTVVAIGDASGAHAPPGTLVVVASEGIVLTSDGVVTDGSDGIVYVAVPDAAAATVAAAAHQQLASVLFPAPTDAPADVPG